MVGGSKGSLLIYKSIFFKERYLYIFVEKGKIFEKKFFFLLKKIVVPQKLLRWDHGPS